jgi:hypothetical protein
MESTTNKIQRTTREYLNTEWDNERLKHSLALTLTMKQKVSIFRLDPERSERNFTHFINRLEKRTFRSSGKRYKKEIKRFPVLEYTNDRFHYHVLIEIPKFDNGKRMNKETFVNFIKDSWDRTYFGYKEVDVQELHSQNPRGWGFYITKFQDSENNRTDWSNVR